MFDCNVIKSRNQKIQDSMLTSLQMQPPFQTPAPTPSPLLPLNLLPPEPRTGSDYESLPYLNDYNFHTNE